MKLSNLCDEDLRKVAQMKTRKGTATSEARRAQQILYTRNVSHGFGIGSYQPLSTLDMNITREYKSFDELHGMSLEEYKEGS
jgi:hypothetical protein